MKFLRRNLFTLTQFFDGGSGGGNGGGAAGGAAGGDAGAAAATGTPPVFNIREHTADDGTFKTDWWKAAGVSEEYAKKFTRPEAAFRSHITAESQLGKKGVIMPGPNATADERNAFHKAMGRPDKPEEYGFTKPATIKVGDKDMPVPDVAWDAKRASSWQAKLHEMGVPKDTANRIMSAALEESVTGLSMIQEAQNQHAESAKAALQKEWGADYEVNIAAARKAAKDFGGDELANHPGLGFDPVMIRALAKIGRATSERPGTGTRQQAGNSQLTAAEANVEARKLTKEIADRTKADRNWANSPEAQQMKSRKSDLFKVANPER